MSAYAYLDQPILLKNLFYPRQDHSAPGPGAFDLLASVEEGVQVGLRFFQHEEKAPWILYFHGNGEVASDYDGIAPFYHQLGVNLVVADYRGYGASTGVPTFSALVQDAHPLFRAVQAELNARNLAPVSWIMGRSMGSIPALELAAGDRGELKGLIIESGFASPLRLLKHLGMPVKLEGVEEVEKETQERLSRVQLPTLLLHGEEDRLVPLEEAEYLEERLVSEDLELISIPRAGHNDIMFVGRRDYFAQLEKFIARTKN